MLELIITALVVALDQWTKHLTDVHLSPLGTSVPLWEGVFHFTSAHNRGAAFGMLQGGRWVFLVVTVAACVGIIYFMVRFRKRAHLLLRICLSLILAGAIGNLIDRVWLGYVRDMLDFRLINFAIFNVADSAVSVGAVLLALDILFGKSKQLYEELEEGEKKKHTAQAVPMQEQAETVHEEIQQAQEQPGSTPEDGRAGESHAAP